MKDLLSSSTKIRVVIAIVIIIPSMAYVFMASFYEIPEANQRTVDTVIGFMLATLLASVVQYFFGSSQGSADKEKRNQTP